MCARGHGERRGGRLPADQVAAAAKPADRQALWDAIRATKGETFVVADIRRATDRNQKTIADYLHCLVAGGFIENAAQTSLSGPARYWLIGSPPVEAPRLRKDGTPVTQGGGTENMWRTMRMLAEFSARDVAAHANTEAVAVSESTAKTYCSMLYGAGYLRQTQAPRPGRLAVYRLIRRSGPRPPMIQRIKRVFDPNTGEVWDVRPAETEDAS